MRLGACISTKLIGKAKEYGYDYCELPAIEIASYSEENWENVKNNILSYDLQIIGFNSFCNAKLPLVGSNVNKDHIISYSKLLLTRGKDLNIKNIGIGAPLARKLATDYDYSIANEQMKWFLTTIAELAKKYNINILYESLNPHCCNYCNNTKESYDMVKNINLDNLHIVWDVYHSVLSKEKYTDILPLFENISHIHICSWNKQNYERYYILEKDEFYIKDLYNFLQQVNYNSSISIEATDASFIELGKSSISLLKSYFK